MDPEGTDHRLAAILSADVAGYSRLMAEDEAATVRTLNDYREAIAMLVRQHRGREVVTRRTETPRYQNHATARDGAAEGVAHVFGNVAH